MVRGSGRCPQEDRASADASGVHIHGDAAHQNIYTSTQSGILHITVERSSFDTGHLHHHADPEHPADSPATCTADDGWELAYPGPPQLPRADNEHYDI